MRPVPEVRPKVEGQESEEQVTANQTPVRQVSDRRHTSEKPKTGRQLSERPNGKVEALMEEFSAWLANSEASAKELMLNAGGDSSDVFNSKLDQLEEAIVSMDCEFNMLR